MTHRDQIVYQPVHRSWCQASGLPGASNIAGREVNAHTAGLDNPQLVRQLASTQDGEKFVQTRQELPECDRRSRLKNHQSGRLLGREPQDLAEIVTESDESSPLLAAMREQSRIRRTAQALFRNRHDIVAGGLEQFQAPPTKVLVELEPYATGTSGTGTMRSRLTSAP
jgi:hypothetical protein